MPSTRQVHRYWCLERHDLAVRLFGQVDVGEPSCYGCGWWCEDFIDDDTNRWHLERAHLIDRCRDGLDGAQNLVLLCRDCHRSMPSFGPGSEAMAMAWVATQPNWLARVTEQAALAATL